MPLAGLRDLTPHEEQLPPRVRVHPSVERPEVRELLPLVARHLVDERTLAVHDLVVRQRQHEVLGVRVQQPERQVAVVVLSMHRIVPQVVERVVHPPHVPLVREPEAAVVHGCRDGGPRGRLLRDREDTRVHAVQRDVEVSDELQRPEVLAPAALVRHPLARLARVVEVHHRRDRIDAQPVDVELLHPIERVRHQEVAHLVPRVVEDERPPVGVLTEPRVEMLVERGPVEAAQRPLVTREVRGHPVDDHADAALVEVIDEPAEVVGRAVPRRRRVVARHLIAPRPAEGMLGDGEQLDVREPEIDDVVGEQRSELAIARALGATSRGAPRRS